jgi:riboflavin synthase
MFSGIIETLGRVSRAELGEGQLTLDLATSFPDLTLGESVAVNGTCLTVVTFDPAGNATFYVSRESLDRTNLGSLKAGDPVNLERAVALSTRLSGHMVQGHVDGLGEFVSLEEDAGAHRIALRIGAGLARYAVEKGSIALDGISLTLNAVEDQADGSAIIRLTIIPHTWTATNLHSRRPGDRVNVESDIIAKYVERLCKPVL